MGTGLNMRKVKKYAIFFVIVILLISYREYVIKYAGLTYEYFQTTMTSSDDSIAIEAKGKELTAACRNKDYKAVRALFSEYAKNNSKDFDKDIDKLVAMLDDETITLKWKIKRVERTEDEKVFIGKFELETYGGTYVVFFIDQALCLTDLDKVGLHYVQIGFPEDNTVYVDNRTETGIRLP